MDRGNAYHSRGCAYWKRGFLILAIEVKVDFMEIKNKSVLVSGGAGFIGSHVVDRLVKENPEKIVVVDNFFLGKKENLANAKKLFPKLKIINQDVADISKVNKIIEENGVDIVFNLAVIPLPTSLEKPVWVFEENVKMAFTFLELARKDKFKTLVHFSSSEAYGTALKAPMDEKHPTNPTTTYGSSKLAADHLTMIYHNMYGIDASIIRSFNNYGPRQNSGSYAGVIPLTINRIKNNKPVIIHGDGLQTRDWIYVTDTADAAVKICKTRSTRGKIINIANGKETTIMDLIKLIVKTTGYKGKIIHTKPRVGDIRRHFADISLAKKLIDFKSKVNLEEGIGNLLEYYMKRGI